MVLLLMLMLCMTLGPRLVSAPERRWAAAAKEFSFVFGALTARWSQPGLAWAEGSGRDDVIRTDASTDACRGSLERQVQARTPTRAQAHDLTWTQSLDTTGHGADGCSTLAGTEPGRERAGEAEGMLEAGARELSVGAE